MRLEVISLHDLRNLDPERALEKADRVPREDMAKWLSESGISPGDSDVLFTTGVVVSGPETRVQGHGLYALGLVRDTVDLLCCKPEELSSEGSYAVEDHLGQFELEGKQYVGATGWLGAGIYILKKLGAFPVVRGGLEQYEDEVTGKYLYRPFAGGYVKLV